MIIHDKCAHFENEIIRLKKENEELKLIILKEVRELTERIEALERAFKNAERL